MEESAQVKGITGESLGPRGFFSKEFWDISSFIILSYGPESLKVTPSHKIPLFPVTWGRGGFPQCPWGGRRVRQTYQLEPAREDVLVHIESQSRTWRTRKI